MTLDVVRRLAVVVGLCAVAGLGGPTIAQAQRNQERHEDQKDAKQQIEKDKKQQKGDEKAGAGQRDQNAPDGREPAGAGDAGGLLQRRIDLAEGGIGTARCQRNEARDVGDEQDP